MFKRKLRYIISQNIKNEFIAIWLKVITLNKKAIIIFEILLIGLFIFGYARYGIPTSPIYWSAFIIEIFLGLVSSLLYKKFLTDQKYKWHLLNVFLVFVGFLAPIILGNTVDYLKPIKSTWIILILVGNSYYVYRIIKKQPVTRQDTPVTPKKTVPVIKFFYWVTITAIFVMVLVVIILTVLGNTPLFGRNPELEIAFSIVFIPFFVFGLFLPNIARLFWKGERTYYFVYYIYLVRSSLFMTTAALGFLMGIFDGLLYTSLLLMLLAGGAMVLTFPTERRWEETRTGRKIARL